MCLKVLNSDLTTVRDKSSELLMKDTAVFVYTQKHEQTILKPLKDNPQLKVIISFHTGDFTGPMNYIRASFRYGQMKCLKNPIDGVPICLIWGTRDGALSMGMAEKSREFSKNFDLKYIEGASHWVQQDEPEKVNSYILRFLEKESLSTLTGGYMM